MKYYEPITTAQLAAFVRAGLEEDIRDGDHTSLACIPADKRDRAKLLVKQDGIIAGIQVAKAVFEAVDSSYEFEQVIQDGDTVAYGDIAFWVNCNSRALLQAERLVLNTMQRMSGIATMSREFVKAVDELPVQILDTRKTTPLLRFLEKEAVRLGGATNYRYGLYDRIMIKDNHTDASGGIENAVHRALDYLKTVQKDLELTVEVRNLEELRTLLRVGSGKVQRVMLDNFSLDLMKEAVAIIGNQMEIEASGGVSLKTVRAIAETGVQFISAGALTHSAGCLDMSLKVVK